MYTCRRGRRRRFGPRRGRWRLFARNLTPFRTKSEKGAGFFVVCSCPLFSPLQLQSSYIYEVSTRAVKKGRGAGEYDHWINSSDTRELSVRWSGAEAPHPHARTSARTTGGNAINNSRPGSGWRNDLCTPQPISCRLGSWIAAMSGAPRASHSSEPPRCIAGSWSVPHSHCRLPSPAQ